MPNSPSSDVGFTIVMNYQQAWDYLDSLQFHKIKLGLDAMRSFMAKVGNPEQSLNIVHVAGTNGKGSVSATLLTLLSHAGYRVGLYTSPHLSSVRERFRINGSFISERKFAELSEKIRSVLAGEKITYFEFTTALAFLWFAEEDPDFVILETGLGGRLDATNIVTPLVSIITNISMDHEAYLGNTIAEVAFEKAGIIKPAVPLVSAVTQDAGLTQVTEKCREVGAPLYLFGETFHITVNDDGSWNWQAADSFSPVSYRNLHCSMKGNYQKGNASLAIAAIVLLQEHGVEISEEQIRDGLTAVSWPGRLESFTLERTSRRLAQDAGSDSTVSFLLDGAHNPAGVESLVQTLITECRYAKLILVWGAMADKDLQQTLPPAAECADLIILTKPVGERSAAPEQLKENVPAHLLHRCVVKPTVEEALTFAEETAQVDDLIVIAGSLYLVGASRKILLGELVDA